MVKALSAAQEMHGTWVGPWPGKTPWRRKWQLTPVFLPGKSHGQSSLAGYSPWAAESDVTEHTVVLFIVLLF